MTSLLSLPREMQLHILSLLPMRELLRLSHTCHSLKDLAKDPSVWRRLILSYKKIKNNTKACREKVARCSKLRELIIIHQEDKPQSDKVLSVVMKAKSTLTTLSIRKIKLCNSSFKKISKLTQLTKLAINVYRIKADGLSDLKNLTKLRSLEIRELYREIYDLNNVVDFFSRLNQLEEVKLIESLSVVKDKVIESLVENNPKLHHLEINMLGFRGRREPFDFLAAQQLTSKGLNFLADRCPQLTHIDIGNSLYIFTNSDISRLSSKCSKLKYVNLENTGIGDAVLRSLAHDCPGLEHLVVSQCLELTEIGINEFLDTASRAKLKHLDIRDCNFSELFVTILKLNYPLIKIVDYDDCVRTEN